VLERVGLSAVEQGFVVSEADPLPPDLLAYLRLLHLGPPSTPSDAFLLEAPTPPPAVRHVHDMSTARPRHDHDMSTTCTRHVHGTSTIWPRHVHDMSTTCPQHVHNMSTAALDTFPGHFSWTPPAGPVRR